MKFDWKLLRKVPAVRSLLAVIVTRAALAWGSELAASRIAGRVKKTRCHPDCCVTTSDETRLV